MSDIVERLRQPWPPSNSEDPLMTEAADEIERLRAENASLASWQCEFTDGKTGLVYGEGGGTYCAMAKRVQKLEAALREIAAYKADEDEMDWADTVLAMNAIARAALEERT